MDKVKDISTKAPKELDKKAVKEETEQLAGELDGLQNVLYAEGKQAVLVVLQGMDASGKDGAIKKVFGRLNPQGIKVESFKAPTAEEMAHDFLWRIHRHAPAKGMIHLFNRSHYEDVLITRVHGWCDAATAKARFAAINAFEQLLTVHNNTHIIKCYLHISQEEQTQRLAERVSDPTKHWKYNAKDLEEAKHWDAYRQMYEEVFEQCNAVPWTIVPADQNWYKEYLITKKVTELLRSLKMQYPNMKQ